MTSKTQDRPSRTVRSCLSALLLLFALFFAYGLLICCTKNELNLFKAETAFLFICNAMCFGSICFLLPKTLSKCITALLIFLICLANSIQLCFYGVFLTYSTLGVIINGTDALTNFPQIVNGTIEKNKYFLLLMLVPLLLSFVVAVIDSRHSKKCFKKQKEKLDKLKNLKKSQKRQIANLAKEEKLSFKNVLICFAIFILFNVFPAVIISGNSSLNSSIFHIFTEKRPAEETVTGIGAFHAYVLDGERLLFGEKQLPEAYCLLTLSNLLDDKSAKNIAQQEKKELFIESIVEPEQPETKYNILDIDFDALLADDSEETIHQMDNYFKNRQPDAQNEFTGLFEGKNLIYITAESFASFAADPEITPTLYRMIHDGFYFTNFYTPYWEVSTTDGEYVNCLGLIPKSGTYSLKDSVNNSLPFALGNQLRKLGYKTMAFHNYLGSYYDRNITHPHLGYKFVSMGDGYRTTEKWPDSDLEMMQETLKEYIDEDKFHVYYMTISGHLPYNFWANAVAIKNKDLVEDLPYKDEAVKAFFACNIELDRALAYLLEELNKKGKAEDTVIVLAADHYPYGLELAQHRMLAKSHVDVTFELYRNSLIIYNPSQEPYQVDKICSNMDIVPTLSNLFGLEYDSRLLMGHDIFSDTPPFVVLKSANVITDKVKYRSDTDTAVTLDGQSVSAEEAAEIKKRLKDEVHYSSLILEKDYYSRVLPQEKAGNTSEEAETAAN